MVETKKTYSPSGDFNSVIPHILAVEGGVCAESAYGIDKNAFPREYNSAVSITNAQGVDSAKQYAVAFYKEKFWDANGMDAVPEGTRDVVFDTTVNHSKNFSSLVVAAAKRGATREEILEMRETEYERLAHANPDKYGKYLNGWKNRLDTFRTGEYKEKKIHVACPTPEPGSVEVSNYRPAPDDEKEQFPFVKDLMKKNPVLGLFIALIGMASGLLDSKEMGSLMQDFKDAPAEQQQKAIDRLPSEEKEQYKKLQNPAVSDGYPPKGTHEVAASLRNSGVIPDSYTMVDYIPASVLFPNAKQPFNSQQNIRS